MQDLVLLILVGILIVSLIPVVLGVLLVFTAFKTSGLRLLGTVLVFGIWLAVAHSWITKGERERKKSAEQFNLNFRPHADYFDSVCKTAGVRIFRKATDVQSVAFQSPRIDVTTSDLANKDFRGDVYGAVDVESPSNAERSFVEAFLTKREWEEQWHVPTRDYFLRYPQIEIEGEQDGKKGYFRYVDASVGSRPAFRKEFFSTPVSRYKVVWNDISTPQDREHWVAGSKWMIVDAQSDEVMAERVGYAIDMSQGNTRYGPTGNAGEPAPPWVRAGHTQYRRGRPNSCPPRTPLHNLDFVRSVLIPIDQEMKIIPRPVR